MLASKKIEKIKQSTEKPDGQLPNIFAALGDRNRFLIIQLLTKHGEICVSDLASILGISVSAVSQHLKILEVSGLVECKRMGQMMCYKPKMNDPNIRKIIKLM